MRYPNRQQRSLWERLTRRGPDGERGSIMVLAAIAMVVVVSSTALAVDLGKTVSTKRSLQEAVDNAALDAVRALGDKFGQAPGLTPAQHATWLAQVNTSTGILNSLLGGFLNTNINLLGYTGIASGLLNLGELRAELGIGSVDQLLNTTIGVKTMLNSAASALQKRADAASMAA